MRFQGRGYRPRRAYALGGRNWRGGRSGSSSVPLSPPPPLGEVLATINHDDIEDSIPQPNQPAQITNTQYLTSYNWISGEDGPEIIVPGEPPEWTPLSKPIQLRGDSGVYFRDLNQARNPTYPLEPMVQAILIDKPEFCVDDLDIVACGSTLGNLLRFVRGNAPTFRMLAEVVGNTVFFIRRQNSPKETIPDIRGFGHAFPEAYTTWGKDVGRSESHQRLITFEFASLNCIVRFESDGYLPDLLPDDLKTHKVSIPSTGDSEPENLLSSLRSATISTIPSSEMAQDFKALQASRRGRHIPQCAVFDLKTRSARKADVDTLSDEMARLWIRQIPNFVLAYHNSGRFNDIRVQDVRDKIKEWEEIEQPVLQRLAALLQMVISFARSAEDSKIELEHDENEAQGVLSLREPGGDVGSVLPPALAENFTSNGHSGSDLGS
ncbi:hypothetical protein N7456_002757 [Penicillium angulare]|uniref:Geranylgeranyl pyrophosphate synthetase n=1 Tax=Penicillium angulare TaxID=116970 RepID=A0A9W9KQM3_9EURO|nr:hypothetical protein N7456_002757 [Penicillium angulare]